MSKEELGIEKKNKISKVWRILFGEIIFKADISFLTEVEKQRILNEVKRIASIDGDLVICDRRLLIVLKGK